MSVCSSTDGSSLRLRKHSSVRNSPTPSTGACAAERAESPSATFASILTGRPSAVAPGPGPGRGAAPQLAVRGRPGRRPPRVRLDLDRAGGAVDQHAGARRRASSRPRCRPRRGCASWRAMIAVWLVGPPRSVTSARTSAGRGPRCRPARGPPRPARRAPSAWARPGSGSPTRWATRRRSMSRRSVTRSAISPPMPVKIAANCSTAACREVSRSSPVRRFLRTAPRRPLSRARPALAVSTSAAAPEAAVGLALEAVGDRRDRVVVRRERRLLVGEPAVAEGADRVGGDLAAGEQRGAVGDARDDGRAVQRRRVSRWTGVGSVRVAMITS